MDHVETSRINYTPSLQKNMFWETANISTTIKDLKVIGMGEKPDGLWGITRDYYKYKQVVMPIIAVIPAVVSFLKQINTAPGILCPVTGLEMFL